MKRKKLYILGPEGTFSSMAARHIDPSGEYEVICLKTINEVGLRVLEDRASIGVLPIENSSTGIIGQSQECISQEDIIIHEEIVLNIDFALLANSPLSEVRHFYAHPQAFNQCSVFISEKLAEADVLYTESNIHSADLFFEEQSKKKGLAAIIPGPFAQKTKEAQAFLVKTNIQDRLQNVTRFLKITAKKKNYSFDFTKKKTSLYIKMDEDKHSLLFRVLRSFHTYEINLCLLHSCPNPTSMWTYSFFIDFYNNRRVEACLKDLDEEDIAYKILGCYDTGPITF